MTTRLIRYALGCSLFLHAAPGAAQARIAKATVVPPEARERKVTLQPQAAEKPEARVTFQADPIADGAIIVVSLGSAGVLELINSTGEIRPQQIAPGFDRNRLIWIDHAAVDQTPSKSAGSLSNLGLGAAAAYAMVDPVLTGVREQNVQAGLVDAIMYAETAAITLALTNVVKMAVRRPRPQAYIDAEAHAGDETWSNASTDSALSFFSGHASMVGALSGTATYLAFARSKSPLRPWLTLALATSLTAFVSVERVQAGKHFPTDVIAGAFAGAGIGVVVPHLHRTADVQQRPVWVGFTPAVERAETRGGVLTFNGFF
ncbi:MAG TPA: phosphatase PAP2 family protein [Polyangiaceae bacterium]|nr:phosphatase PAP2 family protein [Polyangiaceae bacterium]